MLKRITTIMAFVLIGLLVMWNGTIVLAAQSPQVPLAGSTLPQFVDTLPTLSNGNMTAAVGNQPLTLRMCEFKAKVLPSTFVPPAGSTYAGSTWVWGYLVDFADTCTASKCTIKNNTSCTSSAECVNTCASLIDYYDDLLDNNTAGPLATYIGPAIVNWRNAGSTDVTWINDLGNASTTNVLAYKYSTDQTLHWADPFGLMCMMDMCNTMTMCNGGICSNNNALLCIQDSDCYRCTYDATVNCSINDDCMSMIPAPGSDCAENYLGPVPAVAHLHGGEVPAEIDGGPDSWFTSDGQYHGNKYYSFAGAANNAAIYKYPNTQEAAPIWFHDHTLGATRLNVYMGLAGGYLIGDPGLSLPTGLNAFGLSRGAAVDLTVPLVIQDRMFDTDGQLFFPADSAGGVLWALNPEHPYWVPEFVGDVIMVNGKAWPKLDVEPKRYRFLFLNGSNARTYEIFLTDPVSKNFGPPIYVIATDGGYLDSPVKLDPILGKRLVIMPGERYEAIIDFSGFEAGVIGPNGIAYSGNWLLKNVAKTPYPAGAAPMGTTTGRIMQFIVGTCLSNQCGTADTSYNPASGIALRTATQQIVRLTTGGVPPANPALTRLLTLNEIMGMPMTAIDPVTGVLTAYPGGPLEILVNNTKWSGMSPRTYGDFTPITVNNVTTSFSELPREGDTEVWEVVNLTADAHPIHLHLVQFQLINRQMFNVNSYTAAYNAAFPLVSGDPVCTGGVFCPAFGPPLNYDPILNLLSGGKYGGNPDIAGTRMTRKGLQPLYLQGRPQPPLPQEQGWKDTVIMYPGQVTRIAVRWAPTDLLTTARARDLCYPFDPSGFDSVLNVQKYNYVWHCHIVDHEDNEMMRPDVVTLNPSAPLPADRPLVKGIAY